MAQYFSKLWFIIPLAVYLLVNTYVYLHGWWALPSDNAVRIVYAAVFWVCSLSFFIGIAANKFISWRVGAVFSNIGGYWILLFCFFLIACLFADLLRLVQHFADYYPAFVKNNYPLVKQIYFGIVLLGCAGCIIKGHYNFDHTQVVTLNLETAKRQSSIDSLKIAAVSDIHLGNVVRKARLQRYVAQINALQPDIILIAGDIIDHSLGIVRTQHLEDVLPLLHARYGTYAVLGNHDYHSNPDAVCAFMREVGIIPLRDTAVLVDSGFIVAGRDDYSNKQRKPLSDFVDKTAEYPVIMIDHQPTRPQEAAECNVSLQIAGHTHKGQVFPVTLIINKMYGKYTYGYQRDGNTHFYTSSGIGGWGAPLRLGSHSEIVCVNLKFVP